MRYFKEMEIDDEVICEVATALRNGSVVVFPTDTVYGIGCNAYLKEACEKIYSIKGRPKAKPLIVLISDISMLEEIVDFISLAEQELINAFWPGPLTIKFKKKNGVLPDVISNGDPYVRIRLVDKGIVYRLIQEAGVPIVSPSANLSGSYTGVKVENIVRELGDKVDYILDYGDVESDEVSTLVQVENEKVIVLRRGKIKENELALVVPLKE